MTTGVECLADGCTDVAVYGWNTETGVTWACEEHTPQDVIDGYPDP